MLAPWAAVVLILACLGGLLAGLRTYRRRCSPHPEQVRKLLHVGMGLVAAAAPWIFQSAWAVLAAAAASAAGLAVLRLPGPLRRHLGGVVHGVQRASAGEIFFPAGVGLAFVLASGDRLVFCVPVLILALADAAAALVGIRYGWPRPQGGPAYRWAGPARALPAKTLEGSIAFFAVALPCAHVPLVLFAEADRLHVFLVALNLALLLTLVEALAQGGSDNFFIPATGAMWMRAAARLDAATLLAVLGATVALLIAVLPGRSWGGRPEPAARGLGVRRREEV